MTEEQPRRRAPTLPPRVGGQEWQHQTHVWWRAIWHSPMAEQWLNSDIHGGLYRLATYVDQFWNKPDPRLEGAIASLEARFGLSPLDRRRLEWTVSRAEQEKQRKPTRTVVKDGRDPRDILKVIS